MPIFPRLQKLLDESDVEHPSPTLARDETITFNGGSHRDAVRISWNDHVRLAELNVTPLSPHEEERT